MKSVFTLTAATILVAMATSLRAEPQPPAAQTVWYALTVDLRDGSRLLGRPVDFEALPLDTSTGKLKIPLAQIKSFEMKDDKESATVELRDGGRLSGTVGLNALPLQTSIGKLNVRLAEVASCRVDVATVAAGNVALASGGATVSGAFLAGYGGGSPLIDGNTTDYDGSKGFAVSKLPSSWVVKLPRTYLLSEIRLLLWDKDGRFYRYVVETSLDGKTYHTAADRSQGQWRSWQKLTFEPRPARYIRLHGLYNSSSDNPYMHVVELEAYCKPVVPSGGMAEAKCPPGGSAAWIRHIQSGQPFCVVFDQTKGKFDDSKNLGLNDPMGTLKGGETYEVCYRDGKWVCTGFNEGTMGVGTWEYPQLKPQNNQINLWGRGFAFDGNGLVLDYEYGLVGHMKMKENVLVDDPQAVSRAAVNLSSGLLLHYNFDAPPEKTVRDVSGQGIDAKVHGSPKHVEGIAGKGIEFSGSNYLVVHSNPTKRLDRLSVSLWFKTANPNRNYKLAATAIWYRGPGSGWIVGTHYPEFWDTNRKGIHHSGTKRTVPFLPGKWNHLAVVYNGNSVLEYINGSLSRTYQATGKPIGDGGRFEVGAWHPWTAYNYRGAMDEFRLYNRPLSPGEVRTLYQQREE